MSRPPARHRKSSSSPVPAPRAAGAHRRQSRTAPTSRRGKIARGAAAAAAALAGSGLIVSAWQDPGGWLGRMPGATAWSPAIALSLAGTRAGSDLQITSQKDSSWSARRAAVPASGRGSRSPAPSHPRTAPETEPPPVYRNPLRAISGLIPERIDQGVDFGGSGPIYAIGDAVITSAAKSNYGWPGGGWITYQLTSGPAAGLAVFVAEDVRPVVQPGQHVTSSTVIATMYNWGDGIETGWAMPSGFSAESQLAEAGGVAGGLPTAVGLNFEELLQSLGVPAANNRFAGTYGVLPARYPAHW